MAKAKKGGPTALQLDVNTDEEWKLLLNRKGLIVVDVYSDWSGPCAAMVSTLRKIKMDIAGDAINYALARNDEITALERFRGRSEPVWMFIENKHMVNLIVGAHCPELQKAIVEELKRIERGDAPKFSLPVQNRAPQEEARWQREESLRKVIREKRQAKEQSEKKILYEAFLDQMMFELSEETALLLYPWVFKDEDGKQKDKLQCPPYTELAHDLLRQRLDNVEEVRVELVKEMIEKLFVESHVEITDHLIAELSDGKCMGMRLKGRPPGPEWPVPYPYQCPEGTENCPVRKINDVENYLWCVIHSEPPVIASGDVLVTRTSKQSLRGTYAERHEYTYQPPQLDSESRIEKDDIRIGHTFPAAWVPPEVYTL